MTTIFPPDPCATPIIKTKREAHLEALLMMALPYLKREELSTKTSQFTRHLIAEIAGQIEKGSE